MMTFIKSIMHRLAIMLDCAAGEWTKADEESLMELQKKLGVSRYYVLRQEALIYSWIVAGKYQMFPVGTVSKPVLSKQKENTVA